MVSPIRDFDELESALRHGIERIGELRAGSRVESDAFFADPFMSEHTEYEAFTAFREDAPVEIDVPLDDQTTAQRERVDEYVDEVTEFETWEEMQTRAAQEELVDQLITDTA